MPADGDSGGTPTLPPVFEGGGGGDDDSKLKGKAAQHVRMMRRRPKEAPQRAAFVSGLLNEDLQHITKWHGSRPHHEQRRFLRSVDTLYKAFQAQENPPPPNRAQVQAEATRRAQEMEAARQAAETAAIRAAEEDPLNGPPRSPREMTLNRMRPSAASAPNLPSAPIEVFEQRKLRRAVGDEDPNSMERWLEGGSVTTATTGTTATSRFTSFSQRTKTSSGGSQLCSEPGTMQQSHFRAHRRGISLNKNGYANADQHAAGNLKDGIPGFGFPDGERMVTTFKDQFGSRQLGENITPAMYESVFQSNSHPFLARFVEDATPEKKDQFAGMVRSLQYLRMANDRQNKSMQANDLNLEENSRLWKPKPTRPWFDPSNANMSQVPGLGTLSKYNMKPEADLATSGLEVPPPQAPTRRPCPPSPSVSNLGSVPLSRLSTPLVGGKDMPFANAPISH